MRHNAKNQARVLLGSVAVLILVAAAALWLRSRPAPSLPNAANLSEKEVLSIAAQLSELQAREKEADETIWKQEMLAERYGAVLERLWDSLNASSEKLTLLELFALRSIQLPKYLPEQRLPLGVLLFQPSGGSEDRNGSGWVEFIRNARSTGWELHEIEVRHVRFSPTPDGRPPESEFYFSAHLVNSKRLDRAIIEGPLGVRWGMGQDGEPLIERLDASQLSMRARQGVPSFQSVLHETISPFEGTFFIDPLILHDLDGDGRSEIILAAQNTVYRRNAEGRFESETLCEQAPGNIFCGVVADFDRDGYADFLCARFEGLLLFKGSERGKFDSAGQPVWKSDQRLKYVQVLTAGDIDADGDLDVWLGQYKIPYERGQTPTPFFDANDGHPSYLLLNDGRGAFTDATASSGLSGKRWRRTYSASFADLDRDHDLDLVVVSDFAGVDVHQNNGKGVFSNVTQSWIDEPHAFGMAHALADFDRDGRTDLLMVGMNSSTADRLEHLRLNRPGFEQQDAMRARMVYGNRLYSAKESAGFQTSPLNATLARSGWSWGCSAFDFDNDGYVDSYIANGHESRSSVRDYETRFWLHDIYVGHSRENILGTAFFAGQFADTRGRGHSYGGYERNRLFWNQAGGSFLEIAHLMGVALPEDSRNVVADDLDGDGWMDLIVTTFEVWPERKQTLRVFLNQLGESGNWIGVRVGGDSSASPVGAGVTATLVGGTQLARQIVTGDSYRSQHACTIHFGLGSGREVDRIEVRWMGGQTRIIEKPAINRYHTTTPAP